MHIYIIQENMNSEVKHKDLHKVNTGTVMFPGNKYTNIQEIRNEYKNNTKEKYVKKV